MVRMPVHKLGLFEGVLTAQYCPCKPTVAQITETCNAVSWLLQLLVNPWDLRSVLLLFFLITAADSRTWLQFTALYVHMNHTPLPFGDRAFPIAASHMGTLCRLASPRQRHRLLSDGSSSRAFLAMFWPRLCLTITLCSVRFSVSWLTPNDVLFIVKCSCSPRIVRHFNHIHS